MSLALETLEARLASICGAAAVQAFEPDPARPALPLALPATLEQLAECVRLAARDGLALWPLGLGSKLGWARAPERADFALSTRRYCGIESYEPADGTLSARAGTSMAELREAVAAGGHWLTPDVACAGAATIGGVVSAGQSGLDRLRHGPARHHVLGVHALDAAGRLTRSGGQLVKNVTGYDLHRLYCGAHGTLALVTRVSLRLFPAPELELAFAIGPAPHAQLLALARAAADLAARSVLLEGAPRGPGRLHVLLAGRAAATRARGGELEAAIAQAGLASERLEGAAAAARARELCDGECAAGSWSELSIGCAPSRLEDTLTALATAAERAGLAPELRVQPGLAQIDARLLPLGSALPLEPARVEALRAALAPHGLELRWRDLPAALRARADFAPLSARTPGLALMRAIQHQLDPTGVFARGRLGEGL